MYRHIGVPVDLAHRDRLDKALRTAADLARHYASRVTVVAVTGPAPSEVAHTPKEFDAELRRFTDALSEQLGVPFACRARLVSDPAVELDKALDREFHDLGVDLVVMASHVPGFREYVFDSNAGFLASHSDLSVFVVRSG